MPKQESISPSTSSASTTANICIRFWAICRPPSTSGTWQQKILSMCRNLLDHHRPMPFAGCSARSECESAERLRAKAGRSESRRRNTLARFGPARIASRPSLSVRGASSGRVPIGSNRWNRRERAERRAASGTPIDLQSPSKLEPSATDSARRFVNSSEYRSTPALSHCRHSRFPAAHHWVPLPFSIPNMCAIDRNA